MANWNRDQEREFKETIRRFFERKINAVLRGSNEPLKVGDNLATVLRNSDKKVVRIVTPRAVGKWASRKTMPRWGKIIKDPQMVYELRNIGKSIANTMRPLAGNNFASWVARILNSHFSQNTLPLRAVTSGIVKQELNKMLMRGGRDYRPDIDIVLIRTDKDNKVVAIISAKTTLAERIMQTINWSRYLKRRKIKVFLVTAWDTFDGGTNRERVQELDGVYVCNRNVKEYGNIKLFSKIARDLKKLCR